MALSLLDTMEWLDQPGHQFNALLHNVAAANLVANADGRIILVDSREILLTSNHRANSGKKESRVCLLVHIIWAGQ